MNEQLWYPLESLKHLEPAKTDKYTDKYNGLLISSGEGESISYYFGNKIKNLRKKNNITQEKLANYLAITRQTLSQIETGQRILKVNELISIINFFKINPDYFLKEWV